MKALPWFRMYTESRNDSKLDALTAREFRIWHKLLCYSAEAEPRGVVDYTDPEFTAVELRVPVRQLQEAVAHMIKLRLVACEEEFIYFPAFTSRQYDKPSDHPEAVRARVQKHREAKRQAGE